MNNRLYYLVILIPFICISSAQSAQFNIKTDGTRFSGPSQPGLWSPENCYPSLEATNFQVTSADSVIFFAEDHQIDTVFEVPALLGNMALNGQDLGTRLLCGPDAQFHVPSSQGGFIVRGLHFLGDGNDSEEALFVLEGGFESGGGGAYLADSRFENLTGSDDGGVGGSCLEALGHGGGLEVVISNCLFQNNQTRGPGGALYFQDAYSLTIEDSYFIGNESRRGVFGSEGKGGAIAVESLSSTSTVRIFDSLLDQNTAWGPGGTIYIDDGSLHLTRTDLVHSESAVGGMTDWSAGAGVFLRRTGTHGADVQVMIQGCDFLDNTGHIDLNPWAGDGGAILIKGYDGGPVSVEVSECRFEGNFSAQGAGLYMGRFATGRVTRCRFLNNTAYLQGGAAFKGGAFLENEGETAVFEYCEFVRNRAGLDQQGNESLELGRGGAFSTRLYPRAEFYNCTFFNNTAHGPIHEGDAIMLPNEGGEFSSDLRKCQLVNSVFYGTLGNSRQVVVRNGALSLVSHCAAEVFELQAGGLDPVSPVVLASSPFVSATLLYPGPGSQLIDAGVDLGFFTDLDGNTVPLGGGPDIGAFESDIYFVDVPEPENAGLVFEAYPNPFNPRTTIRYELDSTTFVILDIVDLKGRRVIRLDQGIRSEGHHSVQFQGINEAGQVLPSGVYFAKLVTPVASRTQKLTLVR